MLHHTHEGAAVAKKISNRERFVILVKGDVFNHPLVPVRMKIGVPILGREGGSGVPSTADGAMTLELRSRNRRAGGTHIGGLGLSGRTVSRRPGYCTIEIPVQDWPAVEELWDGTGNPLRRIARIYERRLPSGVQCLLLKQILE